MRGNADAQGKCLGLYEDAAAGVQDLLQSSFILCTNEYSQSQFPSTEGTEAPFEEMIS